MAFIDLMKEKAKQDVMTIILPESNAGDAKSYAAPSEYQPEKS